MVVMRSASERGATGPGLLCAALLLLSSPAAANKIILQDALTNPAKCTGTCSKRTYVGSTANFKSNGWHQGTGADYVRYDLGQEVDCGKLEFQVSNFDPLNQIAAHNFTDEYHVLLRLNQDPAGVRITTTKLDSALSLMALKRCKLNTGKDRKIRLCAWAAAGHGANKYTGELKKGFDKTHAYRFEMEWTATKASVKVTDTTAKVTNSVSVMFTYPGCKKDPSLSLRYLYLGRDACKSCGQVMKGPVWSDLKVTGSSSCAKVPVTYQCAAGTTASRHCGKCGTQSRTCSASCQWGSWSSCMECTGPDAGAVRPDSGAGQVDSIAHQADRGAAGGDTGVANPDQKRTGDDVGIGGSSPLVGGCACRPASPGQPAGAGHFFPMWILVVLVLRARSRRHRCI